MSPSARRLTDLLAPDFMNRLDSLDVLSRKILQGKLHGERRSKRRGQSVEFADYRPYVAGDDLRFLDWNIYGRLEQLFLKLFLEEQDLTVHIVVDGSASMSVGEPSKEHFIKKLAAALGYVSLVNNNRVSISFFADGIKGQLANMRGRNYLHQMAEYLLTTNCDGLSDFDSSCRQLAAGRIGSGVMIVLSDFLFKEGLNNKIFWLELQLFAGGDGFIDFQYGHGSFVSDFRRAIELGFAAYSFKEVLKMGLMVRLIP